MIRNRKNPGRFAIGAWSLAIALLPATAYPAGDGPAKVQDVSDPSSITTAAPTQARVKIPPPRVWSQSNGLFTTGQTPVAASAPGLTSALSPVPDSARAQSAAGAPTASTLKPADSEPAESAPAPNAITPMQLRSETGSTGAGPQAASGLPQAAPLRAAASGSNQDSAAPGAHAASQAEAPDAGARPEEGRDDLAAASTKTDGQVAQAGCATCGGFHNLGDGSALHESLGCAGGTCIPGRKPCYPPNNECDTVVGAFLQNLYECLCCPDPCYQPQWVPAANASFFADYARPRTVTRLRYDNLESMTRPDRNQFWIQGVTAMTKNTRPVTDPRARLQQVSIYQEAAGERGSFFIEMPYRQINQSYAPTQAGFSDLNFGMKSLMFDCELLQVSFQFRTFTPTGNGMLNLGTGHFSLDPSLLASLKLGPSTYMQGQIGNWIPLLGNQSLAGGVFYTLMSLNQVLWYATPDSPLIATLEMDIWSFENGGYTAAIAPGQKSVYVEKGGGVSYFNIGPGLRQSICNRFDIGGALTWSTNTAHWAQPWFRLEARFLF